ncbi:MAG: hypothetical protein BWY09_01954 [Candidatus Hydrogenedentes bacterium ADurb.Bin179]|nr:MAG: hypothetical protein BWY09_01954 [Candidatus Hydrogenedentes bacterium ADurb.Bin179]
MREHIRVFKFVRYQPAPFQVGAGLPAEGGLIAIAFQGIFAAAEPRHVFRQVSGAFRHEIPEMAHHLDTHLFINVILGQLTFFLEQGIQVFSPVFHLEKPAHVIDARRQVVNFRLWHTHIPRNQVEGGLYPVAQPDILQTRHFSHRPAYGRHGIDVVEQIRVRTQFFHVAGEVHHDGDGTQRAKQAARPERVADTLVHAMFHRNFTIQLKGVHAADLQHGNDIIGVLQRFPPVQGYHGGGIQTVVLDDTVSKLFHALQFRQGPAHEAELAVTQGGRGHHVQKQGLAENNASRANQCDFRHVYILLWSTRRTAALN